MKIKWTRCLFGLIMSLGIGLSISLSINLWALTSSTTQISIEFTAPHLELKENVQTTHQQPLTMSGFDHLGHPYTFELTSSAPAPGTTQIRYDFTRGTEVHRGFLLAQNGEPAEMTVHAEESGTEVLLRVQTNPDTDATHQLSSR